MAFMEIVREKKHSIDRLEGINTIYSVPGFGIRLVYMQNHHNKQAKLPWSQSFFD